MTFSVALPVLIRTKQQYLMTQYAVGLLRAGTSLPFEIVIVETESRECESLADRYIHHPHRRGHRGVTKDYNDAIDACTGEFVIHTANDVWVGQGWLEALLRPFEQYPDCGVSTIAIKEIHGMLKQDVQPGVCVEGMYGPFMMFRKGWRLDEEMQWGVDSDLVMRIYAAGLRAYRCFDAYAIHENMSTWKTSLADEVAQLEAEGQRKFHEKWGQSPLWMAKMIQHGAVVFGHEHEAVRLR